MQGRAEERVAKGEEQTVQGEPQGIGKGEAYSPSTRHFRMDTRLCGTAEGKDIGIGKGVMVMDEQELQMWRDFDKWLKEVALGEEQYNTLMAEFCKDYSKGITLEGETYSVGHNEEQI